MVRITDINRIHGLALPAAAFCAVLAFCGGCRVVVREADLFIPKPVDVKHWQAPPAMGGVRIQPVEMDADGCALRGWIFAPPVARRAMVYFCGNGEGAFQSAPRLGRLAERLDCEILLLDYRGFGFSEGQPSFDALLADGLRAWDLLARRSRTPRRATLLYGRSLGAIVALHVALRRDAAGLILEAPPTSAAEVVPGFRCILPAPVRWLVRLRPDEALRSRRPQPVEAIADLTCPLLVIHGADDRVIPPRFGRRMHDVAGSRHKMLLTVARANHYRLDPTSAPAVGALRRFVQNCERLSTHRAR
jgi:pimeloyl-ACP methyl ester carboxylesterase